MHRSITSKAEPTRSKPRFLLLAGTGRSLIHFRGRLIQALQAAGLEVHVAAPIDAKLRLSLDAYGVVSHNIGLSRTGMNPLRDAVTIINLCRLVNNIKPDYMLAYTIKPVIYGLLASTTYKYCRRFALITGLGYVFVKNLTKPRNSLLFWLVTRLYRFSLNKADLVFFQNKDDETLFRKSGILKGQVQSGVINGSGVDLQHFHVAPIPLSNKINFLFIGRLLKSKGIVEFVRAAQLILNKGYKVEFTVVGRIDDNPDSIAIAQLNQWIRDGIINYLGQLDDVRPAISRSHVYVLPSYREGTPRSVLEAMSMGRPIITTDAPGCRDTVVRGLNGYLIPAANIDKLVEAMELFIGNMTLITRMGVASRKLAEDKYDVHSINRTMLKMMKIPTTTGAFL